MRMFRTNEGKLAAVRSFGNIGSNTFGFERGQRARQVVDVEREEVHTLAILGEELRNRTLLTEWGDKLNLSIPNGHESIANTQCWHLTRWLAGKTKVFLVRRNASFEIIDGNNNVIEALCGKGAITRLTE